MTEISTVSLEFWVTFTLPLNTHFLSTHVASALRSSWKGSGGLIIFAGDITISYTCPQNIPIQKLDLWLG